MISPQISKVIYPMYPNACAFNDYLVTFLLIHAKFGLELYVLGCSFPKAYYTIGSFMHS